MRAATQAKHSPAQFFHKLSVIPEKYESKALNRSEMVVILNYLALIWRDLGLIQSNSCLTVLMVAECFLPSYKLYVSIQMIKFKIFFAIILLIILIYSITKGFSAWSTLLKRLSGMAICFFSIIKWLFVKYVMTITESYPAQ